MPLPEAGSRSEPNPCLNMKAAGWSQTESRGRDGGGQTPAQGVSSRAESLLRRSRLLSPPSSWRTKEEPSSQGLCRADSSTSSLPGPTRAPRHSQPQPRLCRAVREACASAPPCAQLPARLLPVAQQRRCEMLAAKHTRSAPALLGAGPQRQMGCGLHLAPSFILHRVLMPPGTPYATKCRDF